MTGIEGVEGERPSRLRCNPAGEKTMRGGGKADPCEKEGLVDGEKESRRGLGGGFYRF